MPAAPMALPKNKPIMRETLYLRRSLKVAMLALALAATTALMAQEKPDTPVNLRADVNYSLVGLSWQRSATVADTLLSEGFESATFPPEGWTLDTTNENDPSYTWFCFPTATIMETIDDYESYIHSGSQSAFINIDMGAPYDDGTPGTQDEWLTSPAVKGASYLDFYCKIPSQILEYGADESFPNHYYVLVSHDGGSTWRELWDGRYDSNGSDDWQAVSLYLGDPSEGDPMVAFQATSGSDDPDMSLFCTWAIDDIRFTNGTPLSAAMETFSVYRDGEAIAEGLKALSFTDGDEKEPGEHLYEVRSHNSSLAQLSDPAQVTVNVEEATTNAPRNLRLTSTYDEESGTYSVDLSWDAPEGSRQPAYYTAYCNNAMFGDWLEETGVGQTGLAKGVYNYSVVAVYQFPDGESEAVADQVALGTRYPARNLTATRNSDGSLSLKWAEPKASDFTVSEYKLYRGNELLARQADKAYTEAESVEGRYDYSVVAVYSDGVEATATSVSVENGDAPVYEIPFEEDFTGALKPGNWTVTKNRTGLKDNYLWRFDNWYELPVSGSGFDTDFASTNCSSAGFTTVNTSLLTPAITRTSLGQGEATYLSFDMDYKVGGTSFAYVAYSDDGGENWYDLVEELTGYTADDLVEGETCRPQHLTYEVTDLFDLYPQVMFAWIYNGKRAQHIAIDNVRVFNADPSAIKSLRSTRPSYVYADGTLMVQSDGMERVRVYAPDGTLVADTPSRSVAIARPGVYLICVSTASGQTTIKAHLR